MNLSYTSNKSGKSAKPAPGSLIRIEVGGRAVDRHLTKHAGDGLIGSGYADPAAVGFADPRSSRGITR